MHHIKLDGNERDELEAVCRRQNAATFKVARVRAFLAMDSGPRDPVANAPEASALSGLSVFTLERLSRRVCEIGALGARQSHRGDRGPHGSRRVLRPAVRVCPLDDALDRRPAHRARAGGGDQ